MRLASFIETNMEAILVEWETFARSLYPVAARMTPHLLRDHAQQILLAVVADLSKQQSGSEQKAKSLGRAPGVWNAPETAAQTHAVLRAQSGIDINPLAAEYRALRASVVRLWEAQCELGAEGLQDMIRFNEAIDQALAESIKFFDAQVENARNLLLGMLGHDMRNPLNAIVMTALELSYLNVGTEVSEAAGVLIRSGASITALLEDLVEFKRTNFGLGINIEVGEVDLGLLFADEVKQLEVADPTRRVLLTAGGEVRGRWDGRRLQQALRNLVSKACAYGVGDEPVRVVLQGHAEEVTFDVRNRGPAIDPEKVAQLFNPLQRGELDGSRSHREGLGLGLYIVREIARAHGGEVNVRSSAEETVLTVHLPRTFLVVPRILSAPKAGRSEWGREGVEGGACRDGIVLGNRETEGSFILTEAA